ncbi:uncharacterized protein PRCAT00003112001 [Priceomyces carsonii]|uniref:uncharacterized protein n=1 Tax=Priceomyces carsonii TaxID=28549 RepID=UPI002ED84A68|nr:unnamed protein product [Priceomyces carsonii]
MSYTMSKDHTSIDSTNDRFHLRPAERMKAVASVSALIGGMTGLYEGIKTSSLRYLAENGHRLPRNVGGWYFYHKRKNYVMIINGCKEGVKLGLKFSTAVTGFFGLEWFIDSYVRNGTIDFLNTTIAATISSSVYALYRGLSGTQMRSYMKKGCALGLSFGISQDLLIFVRGGHIWYLDGLGIKNPRKIEDSKLEA